VLEITEPLSIVPVPGAPSYVLGLSNWRNNPVPMIDLNIRLRMGASLRGEGTCFLIVRAPGISDLVGFPIKPDARMHILPLANVPCDRDLPLDRSLTRGIFDLTNATLVVPDMSRIIQV
jgi:chemotaxis signal transduction protein